jgi:hypothetical protein
MGTFNTGTITSSGTERDFLTLVYNYIMGLWGGITCSVTNGSDAPISPATPADFVWTASTISYMDFGLDENAVLRVMTYPEGSPKSRGYNISLLVNGTTVFTRGGTSSTYNRDGVCFCGNYSWVGDGVNPYSNATRTYILSSYVSDNVKIIWFAQSNASSYSDSVATIVIFNDNNNNMYYGGYLGEIPESATMYDATGSTSSTKSSMFSYTALAGYIDYITESAFVSGGVKIFSTSGIYDCSTVTFGSTITLNDGNYMAVGSHSLVKL